MTLAPDITYIGRTNFRNAGKLFGIRQADRRSHMLVIGATGTGKSHLLELIAEQDVTNGRGFILFDPHGDLARTLKASVSDKRSADLVYIDPLDPSCPWRFNPFSNVARAEQPLAAAGVVEVFKKIWEDDWGPRLEHLLRNVAYTLLENPGTTFADIPALLTDRTFRLGLTHDLENPVVRAFWHNEFEKLTPAFRSTVISPLQNKIGALLTDPTLRRFFSESGDPLDLPRLMNEGAIVIVNLDKGQLGEGPAILLGSLLLSHVSLAGLGRSKQPQEERRDFAVFLDEFQLFTTQAIANMLSELRKFRVSMVLATQFLSGIDRPIRDAMLGNVGTIVSFRLGATDAAWLVKEFGYELALEDLVGLPRHHMYVRLLVDGAPASAFSAVAIPDLRSASIIEH